MHPLFLSTRTLGPALALWLVIEALVAWLAWQQHVARAAAPPDAATLAGLLGFIILWYSLLLFLCLPSFYIAKRLPWRGASASHAMGAQLGAQLGGLVTALTLWWFIGGAIALLLEAATGAHATLWYRPLARFHLGMGALLYCTWLGWHWLYLDATGEAGAEEQHLQQQLLVSEVELQAIKASLHPHFLYNGLNLLANVALVAPEKVRVLCVQMAEFLRYSLRFGEKPQTTLAEELAHVNNYLNIERERCGERLQVHWEISDEARSVRVFPLLLFPLVENAVKHGIGSSIEPGFVMIQAKLSDHWLWLAVHNNLDPDGRPPHGTGQGLRALAKRLHSHYGAQSRLTTRKLANEFQVTVQLPRLPT